MDQINIIVRGLTRTLGIVGRYTNQRVILGTTDKRGANCATLTVNMPNIILEKDEIIVKNWSENVDVAVAALDSGLFVDTGRVVPTGFVLAPIWKIK